MSNYINGNNNKNKLKSKDKNSFLNTNYKLKSHHSKFNSIGKLISMNYPYVANDKTKKSFSKNQNNLKKENNERNNNLKEKMINGSNINEMNSNIQGYNSKSENDLCSSLSEKDLYGTIQNFSKRSTPKKAGNNLKKVDVMFKNDESQLSSLHNGDILYKNFFSSNKFQKTSYQFPNKYTNQTHGLFFSRSSEKQKKTNKRNSIQDNKSNDSFGKKNYRDNKLVNSSDFHKNAIIEEELKKKTINVYNSQEFNKTNNYYVSSYGSYTLGGTDAFGHPKTNQDSYIVKEEESGPNNKEYTFGVFDGHGLQGHLVSEGIKNYLMNCSNDNYTSKKKIVAMFNSLSKSIETSKDFDVFCSGSTAVIVHVTKEKIICANCGDSRAIVISGVNNGVVKISRDHKPELTDEKKRIIAAGGRVDRIYGMGPYRVWFKDGDYPGLAMSRSIGDALAHKVGVSNIPEIMEFNINNVKPIAVVAASDGVWEFMTNEQVKNIINKYKFNQDAYSCSKEIVERARQIWKGTSFAIDDITCVIAFFDKN